MASTQLFRTLSTQTLFAVVAGHNFDAHHVLHVVVQSSSCCCAGLYFLNENTFSISLTSLKQVIQLHPLWCEPGASQTW